MMTRLSLLLMGLLLAVPAGAAVFSVTKTADTLRGFAILALALDSALPANATLFEVTKTADTFDGVCDRDCSLREAIAAANEHPGTDFVRLGPRVYAITRPGRNEEHGRQGDFDVRDNLVILGAGADKTILDGGGLDRVLHGSFSVLELHGVTIRNGRATALNAQGDGGDGGGILGDAVRLFDCEVTGNRADAHGGGVSGGQVIARATTFDDNEAGFFGGGVAAFFQFIVENVTLSANRASAGGGAFLFAGEIEIRQTTITGNSAEQEGGGILFTNSDICPDFCSFELVLSRSVVAGNSAAEGTDCRGADSNGGGHNVFGDGEGCRPGPTDLAGTAANPLDPRLAPLGANGGSTLTHALLPGSPAIDLAPAGSCSAADQRGRPRPIDGDANGGAGCDAGAFERSPACEPSGEALCLGDRFQASVRWTALGSSGKGKAVPLTADTGAFWFFDPANLELKLKVLDGCGVNDRFWVFLSGLTDVAVTVTVRDTFTGQVWEHRQAGGTPLPTRLDTDALAVCSGLGPVRGAAAATPPQASSILRVTKTADTADGHCDDDCSLREAVVHSNFTLGPQAILLGPGVYKLTRKGIGENAAVTGDLDVLDELLILGAGAGSTILDGDGIDRVLEVHNGASLEMHDLTVRNGWARPVLSLSDIGAGGGIHAIGPLALMRCGIEQNRAEDGGGISALSLTARDSTISNNEASRFGGGIEGGDRLRLENVTLSGNHAHDGGGMLLLADDQELSQVTVTGNTAEFGGGFYLAIRVCIPEDLECTGHPPPRLVLSHSIIAGNSADEFPDCVDLLDHLGGLNLFGVGNGCHPVAFDLAGSEESPLDPRLSALGDHGGPTPTHLPLAGSPAIDFAGASCSATDQRGALRPADGDGDGEALCDSGAVEVTRACVAGPTRLCLQEGRFAVTARWAAQGSAGAGQALPLTSDTGAFWFFQRDNLELSVKILNGCALNDRIWVFLSGLTDVEVEVTVEDTVSGKSWTHFKPAGTPLQPRLDTDALEACP